MTLRPRRLVRHFLQVLLMAIAGAVGVPMPKLLRHEDPVAQVAGDEAAKE
jgi:hypothetical protein